MLDRTWTGGRHPPIIASYQSDHSHAPTPPPSARSKCSMFSMFCCAVFSRPISVCSLGCRVCGVCWASPCESDIPQQLSIVVCKSDSSTRMYISFFCPSFYFSFIFYSMFSFSFFHFLSFLFFFLVVFIILFFCFVVIYFLLYVFLFFLSFHLFIFLFFFLFHGLLSFFLFIYSFNTFILLYYLLSCFLF